MEEIIELIKKAKIRYNSEYIQLTFWELGIIAGEIYNFDTDKKLFIFNSIDELRTHLNE